MSEKDQSQILIEEGKGDLSRVKNGDGDTAEEQYNAPEVRTSPILKNTL